MSSNIIKEFYINQQGKKKLCNELIFDIFFKYLLKIDTEDIDILKFSISIRDNGYYFNLISKNDKCLKLLFDLWADQVNIYLGDAKTHTTDDAMIKGDKAIGELQKHLYYLFYSNVTEELTYSNDKLREYKYIFQANEKYTEPLIINRQVGLPIFNEEKRTIKNDYAPWIKVRPIDKYL